MKHALAQLEQAELVFRRGEPPEAVYSFKHALVRDAAYESLLKSRRQQLHGQIARALEESFADIVASASRKSWRTTSRKPALLTGDRLLA